MQSYDINRNHQGNNVAAEEGEHNLKQHAQAPITPQQGQAANTATTPKPTLQQNKAQQKLKKKLDEDEKNQTEDDSAAESAADELSEITTQDSHGNVSNPGDSSKLAARKTDGAVDGTHGADHADSTKGLSEAGGFSSTGKQYLAANTNTGKNTTTDVGSPIASAASGVEAAPAVANSVGIPGWALAGLALGGIVAAAANGGDGGRSNNSSSNSTTPVSQTTLSGVVMAGPVLPGANLSVKAYTLDGRELGSSAVNDKGEYNIVLPAGYSGPVKLSLIDGNGNAVDYWDEASGKKDIGDLSAIGNIKAGQSNIIMMTPLTHLAANKLAGQTPSESQINAANKAVADLFGIDNILTTAPKPVVTESGADNLPNANTYGKALAALSAAEEKLKQNHDPDPAKTVLDTLVKGLPNSSGAAPSEAQEKAAKDMLLDGLQEAANKGQVDKPTQQAIQNNITTTLSPEPPAARLSNDSGIANDNISKDGSVTVTGIASGNTWEYSVDGGSTWKPGTGSSIAASEFGADGAKTVQVRQINSAGNAGLITHYNFTLDTTNPNAPAAILKQDTGTSNSDNVTNNAELKVTGLEPGATWQYSLDGGKTWTAGSGTTIPVSALGADGSKTVQVRQSDAAGNTSAVATATFMLDTTTPKPVMTLKKGRDSTSLDLVLSYNNMAAGDIVKFMGTDYAVTAEDAAAGKITFKIEKASLTEGSNTFTVTVTDAAGNTGSSTQTLTLDITPPATPTVTLKDDTGTAGDKISNKGELTVSGLEANATWEYSLDGGNTWTAGSGTSIPASALGADGNKSVQIRQTDAAGNISAASSAYDFTLDTVAPEAPKVALLDDTGIAGDKITSTAVLIVTVWEGASWQYSLDGGATWKAGRGNAIPPSEFTGDGKKTVQVKQTDAAGNESGVTTYDFTITTSVAELKLQPSSGQDAQVNASEADAKLDVSYKNMAAGDVIQLKLGANDLGSPHTVTAEEALAGKVTLNVNKASLAEGSNTITATVTDVAGNNATSSAQTITLDTTVPEAPTAALKDDTGRSSTDNVTSNAELNVTGIEPGATWQYSLDGGKTWTAGSGTTIPASALGADGSKTVQVRQTDAAGNTSAASSAYTFALDTTAPTPTMTLKKGRDSTVFDLDVSYNNMAAGDIVKCMGANYTMTAEEAAAGKITFYMAKESLTEGSNTITITVTDAAGNTGSSTQTLTLDTTPPAAPTLALKEDSGSNNGDKISSKGELIVSGLEANATWEYSLDGGNTWTAGSGTSIPASALGADGSKSVQVRQTDAAGNTSAPSSAYTFTLDTTAPAAPTAALKDDTGTPGDKITNKGELTVSGLEANATWEYSLDGGHTWTAGSGTSIPASALGSDGSKSVQVRQTDAAGNTSAPSSAETFTLDTQAPAVTLLTGDAVALSPQLNGTTDANTKVKVEIDTDNNTANGYEVTYETQSDANGYWSVDTASAKPTQGTAHTFKGGDTVNVRASASDQSGNQTTKTATSKAEPSLYSVSDAQVIEGTDGTREMVFTVTRSGDLSQPGTVDYNVDPSSSAKSGGTGADNDYSGAASGTVSFAPGETSKQVKFTIHGDNYRETNENIVLNLEKPTNGSIADGHGVGHINEVDSTQMQAAYGLRDLNPQSNDYAIRVRRSSDNAEMDIGFDANGNLDTKALLDFVGRGANDKGFVTTWYDQSGNKRDMTQTDAGKQGVIVDGGQLVTRADGSPAISFNNGRNGANDDGMSAKGVAANDWKSVLVYAKVQSEGNGAGSLFNLGEYGNARLSAHYPDGGNYLFDVNIDANPYSLAGPGRLQGKASDPLGKANDVVFEAHSGRTSAGDAAKNYTDGAQVIYENGVRKLSDGDMTDKFATSSKWYLAQHGAEGYFQQAMYNEFMVYLSKDDSNPTVQNLLGTTANDTLTYSGESGLKRIDGISGDDTLYISGAANLDLSKLSGGMRNIDQIRMDNGQANTLTLTDAQIATNGAPSLTISMDAGDKVVFNGVDYNYGANLQTLVLGSSGNDVITSTARNDLMNGGAGADTFTWLQGQSGQDTVKDYNGAQGDKLDLSKLLEGYTAGSSLDSFIHKVVNADGSITLEIDREGGKNFGAAADLFIVLQGVGATDPLTVLTSQGSSVLGA